MSVRQVQCPACKATANILVTMTNVRCPSCSHVWNTTDPKASAPQPTPAKSKAQQDEEEATNEKAILASVIGGAIALLVLVGLLFFFVLGGKNNNDGAAADSSNTNEPAETNTAPKRQYKVVEKLSVDTRKKLFREYKQMAATTIDKKIPIPSKSPVHGAVKNMLNKTADRELRHFSLLYNITENQVLDVVAEGEDKSW